MKILCVIDSLSSGGAQRQLVELAKGFKERGNHVSFLIYHDINFFHSILDEAQIPVQCIEEPNQIRRIFKIRKAIKQHKPDTVLSFLEGANFLCEIAGFPFRKWKLIVGERSANPGIKKSRKLRIYRWFHFFANYVVANSYANIRIFKEVVPFFPSRKIKVIYNMVDFNRWQYEKNQIRKTGKFRLLVASNHQSLKNAKGLVTAVNLLPEFYKNQLVVHWYGRKNSYEVIHAFNEAKQLLLKYALHDIIEFRDPHSSINEIMGEYDAVGLFSFYEGLPNSICEGMASGKPVIVTDVSDNKLIINQNFGLVIERFSPEAIRDSIIRLLEVPDKQLEEMGKESHQRAKELFKKENIIDNYLNLMSCSNS